MALLVELWLDYHEIMILNTDEGGFFPELCFAKCHAGLRLVSLG